MRILIANAAWLVHGVVDVEVLTSAGRCLTPESNVRMYAAHICCIGSVKAIVQTGIAGITVARAGWIQTC